MARRSKNQARRSGSRSTPGWVWLLVGLLVGVAVAIGYYLSQGGKVNDLLPKPNPGAEAPLASEEPVAQNTPPPRKPKYDFYTVLPEKEVLIPDAELRAQAKREAEAAAADSQSSANPDAAVIDSVRYLLQAGAFRSQADAEAVKARIALSGEMARVEAGDSQGAPIFRVRLGPYPNASALAQAKSALAANGIEAQAIKAQ